MPSDRSLKSFTRRQALRLVGSAAAAGQFWSAQRLLAGCAAAESTSSGSLYSLRDPEEVVDSPYDPSKSWWMQNEYAPTLQEHDVAELEVVGSIPPELDGLFVRNGANHKHGDPGHWFLGNGMVHGVRFRGGRALWYKNRWVQTPLLADPTTIPSYAASGAAVSVTYHASQLFAAGEYGMPYRLSVDDLGTLGPQDYAGKLDDSFTAHPKIDAVSGEMFAFSYPFTPPFLRYYRIDPRGQLVAAEDIELPLRRDGLGSKLCMIHDFAITASKVIFLKLPVVFDLADTLSAGGFPFLWDESNGAHIGVMPRNGKSADITWIEIDPCYVFHTANAYDDEHGNVVLDVMRMPDPLWVERTTGLLPEPTYLSRYTIDPAGRTAKVQQLDDRIAEFPRCDERLIGRQSRYVYALEFDTSRMFEGHVTQLLKYDLRTDQITGHSFGAGLRTDEAVFVPARPGAGEDEGYLVSFVYDRRTDRSSVYILDASNMSAAPIAQVHLPVRVPVGFHGTWVPA